MGSKVFEVCECLRSSFKRIQDTNYLGQHSLAEQLSAHTGLRSSFPKQIVGAENAEALEEYEEAVVTFQPGSMGLTVDGHKFDTVEEVDPGGQAERQGVKVGWKICAIGDVKCTSFSDKVFRDAR